MRQVELAVRAEESFPIPVSDGYAVYGALLDAVGEADAAASERVHESPLGSLHSSGLLGSFDDGDRPYHKRVRAGESYRLSLGVVDPNDRDVFQALVSAFVLDGETIELDEGTLRVESFESERASHGDLLDRAGEHDDPYVGMRFRTPTCIEDAEGITTMFPTRGAVFTSLLRKWNRSRPADADAPELDVTRREFERNLVEKPDADTYETHSVVVARFEDDDGHSCPRKMQGFSGECGYMMKDASESIENAVTALALFAEFAGVGSAVARGCGTVETEVT